MLVLSRKENESIMIGEDIIVTVTKIQGGKVTIGFVAPKDVIIVRGEISHKPEKDSKVKTSVENGIEAKSETESAPLASRVVSKK